MTVVWDYNKALEVFNNNARKALTMIGIQTKAKAQVTLNGQGKRDTGLLMNSIGYKVKVGEKEESDGNSLDGSEQSDNSVIVGTNVDYANYIEGGSGPHRTDYKSAEFLENINKWLDRHGIMDKSARFLIIRSIRRHGTSAHPFLRPALDYISGKARNIIQSVFRSGENE